MGIAVDGLAAAIMEGLEDYADLATEAVKAAVKSTAKSVKSEISANAPRRTGKYASSWTTKTTAESANGIEITVYSKDRYQLAHLLEHGHAKRNGGRVAAQPHIAAAEQNGITQIENEIERSLRNG